MENPQPTPSRHDKRVALADGGGIKGQIERHRLLREHLVQQYYKGLKNPQMLFKGPHELAAEFCVTEKTIRKDICYLQSREHLPIDYIRARAGYGLLEEIKSFAGDEFTRGEYLALWLSVQSFEAWGGLPQQKKMPTILRKLKSSAAAMNPDQLRRMRQSITFKAGGFQAPVDQGIFETVLDGVLNGEELRFGYISLDQRRAERASKASPVKRTAVQPEIRTVLPVHLLCWEYAWYLFAWDPARADIRTFALSRMSGVSLTGTEFTEVPVKFDLRKELEKSFGITRGGKPVPVHLRFQPRAIPLIVERLWHPTQEMIENEDGTLDLTMKVAIVPELVRWAQSWGDDIAILAPTSLDDEVLIASRKRLEEAARRRGIPIERVGLKTGTR